MDATFDIEVDDKTEPDYDISSNFAENLVDVIRSEMVGNEGQFLSLNAAYASGLSRDPEEYLQMIVRGKSGEGKTELKQNVDSIYPDHWLLRTGSTSDMGLVDSDDLWDGVYVGAFAEFQQMQGKMLEMVKSCVTSDHDVVTPNGLVNIREVNIGDEVLSWNPDTGMVQIKTVEQTHHYPNYDGEVEMWDTRDVSLTMTDNHRVPISVGGRGGEFEETNVGDISNKQIQLPSGNNGIEPSTGSSDSKIDLHKTSTIKTEVRGEGVNAEVRHDKPSEKIDRNSHSWVPRYVDATDFSRLCAWYTTEGAAHHSASGELGGSNVTITQGVESDYHEDIVSALEDNGLTYSVRLQDRGSDARDSRNVENHQPRKNYRVTNSVIHDILTSMCGDGAENKQVPEWVYSMEYEDREQFRQELMKGDGDEKETSHRYTTISDQLRDDLIRLGFENGITANYTTEVRDNPNWNDCHRVRFNTDWQNVQESQRTRTTADDGVYCLTVEDNGTFITGRDGNFSVTYNSAGDDADEDGVGFSHTRNVDDGDGGREADEIEKQAMPTVFLFADENNKEIPKELETRQMVVRVESDEEINRAVAKTKFDHNEVEVGDRDYEYNFNFEEGKKAVRSHIANIPKPLDPLWSEDPKNYAYPVVIPHDESVEWPINDHEHIDHAGWDIFKVVDDILSYKKTQSKRGAQSIANHIRGHTRLNHHNRETMDINGVTHYVAEPQDVANVLSYRDLLLAVTHDINEQKLAVIEALTDETHGVGGTGPNGGLQATHMDIREFIDEYSDITTPSKSQLTNGNDNGVLDAMEEDYLIEVHEGDGPNGAHMYEFLGGNTFGHPNLDVYADLFEYATDPIRDQPIAKTVTDFKAQLSVKTTEELMAEDPMESLANSDDTDSGSASTGDSLSDYGATEDTVGVEWDEVDTAIHERLQKALDDARATPDDVGSLSLQHMVGVSPVEYYTDETGFTHVRAERPKEAEDKRGTIMDSSHELWGDKSDSQVESRIENTIARLRDADVFEVMADDDSEFEDSKYLVVRDIE